MTIIKDETLKKAKNKFNGRICIYRNITLNGWNIYILILLQNKDLKANIYVSFFALNCKITINKITNPKELIKIGYFTRDKFIPGDTEFE